MTIATGAATARNRSVRPRSKCLMTSRRLLPTHGGCQKKALPPNCLITLTIRSSRHYKTVIPCEPCTLSNPNGSPLSFSIDNLSLPCHIYSMNWFYTRGQLPCHGSSNMRYSVTNTQIIGEIHQHEVKSAPEFIAQRLLPAAPPLHHQLLLSKFASCNMILVTIVILHKKARSLANSHDQ